MCMFVIVRAPLGVCVYPVTFVRLYVCVSWCKCKRICSQLIVVKMDVCISAGVCVCVCVCVYVYVCVHVYVSFSVCVCLCIYSLDQHSWVPGCACEIGRASCRERV